ncbi:MFS transporter [Cellulomonas sp. Y8]|uniref:MFS transporter n=1 Tax=Cellulomonas sp. Y8 TaxID=2591145 RepID=UPI003D7263E8
MTTQTARTMTRGRTVTFAVAAGMAVGSLYLAQPLIEVIADSLAVPATTAAVLVTVTQVGYALGIFLLVPLGDVLNRRRLIPTVLGLSAVGLVGAALAPTFSVLLAALAALGLTTVSAQLLTPLASELAADDQRGKVVGTVASGALIGILLSRTVSGVVAELWGWRAIFAGAAAVIIALAFVLRAIIPELDARERVPYLRLLGSVFTTVTRYRAVGPTLLISAAVFAVFSMFWTALTYLLTAEPFGFSVAQIGLVGIAGLAGALAARRVGALSDRGWSVPASGAALALLLVSLVAAWASHTSILALLVVIVVFDVAAQGNLVLAQTRLLSLPGNARSRLNTAIVVSNFLGGALGSALAGRLWAVGGWDAVVLASCTLTLFALLVWAVSRRRLASTH